MAEVIHLSQERAILKMLREGPKTLSQIIRSPYGLAAEYRRAMSCLRKKGYVINHHKHQNCKYCEMPAKCPAARIGENVYSLDHDLENPVHFTHEQASANTQGEWQI